MMFLRCLGHAMSQSLALLLMSTKMYSSGVDLFRKIQAFLSFHKTQFTNIRPSRQVKGLQAKPILNHRPHSQYETTFEEEMSGQFLCPYAKGPKPTILANLTSQVDPRYTPYFG